MPPLIIPIFISHQGCPQRCIFCNQNLITGIDGPSSMPTASTVTAEITKWLRRSPAKGRSVQVAFYGGSFTGLPQELQVTLLQSAKGFITKGLVDSIRLSTRPDYIDDKTAGFLKGFGVNTVEIGVQSMDQNVLNTCCRGHEVHQTEKAVELLKSAGLTVGAQLMVGLPGETTRNAKESALRLSRLKPHFARIYPTLILKNSALAQLYNDGRYRPLSLNRAIARSLMVKTILEESHIQVIRVGLQPSALLEKNMIAGPYHPSFGELIASRALYKKTRAALIQSKGTARRIFVSDKDQSIFYGIRKCSLKRLQALNLIGDARISFSPSQKRNTVQVECDV